MFYELGGTLTPCYTAPLPSLVYNPVTAVAAGVVVICFRDLTDNRLESLPDGLFIGLASLREL